MSGQSGGLAITLGWGDGDHTFRLPVGAWRKIEAKCAASPEEIIARLAPSVRALENQLGLLASASVGLVGRWRVDDVREVLLQGLLYGEPDLGPVRAATLIRDFVDERPLRENVMVAFAIAMVAIEGLPEAADTLKAGDPKPGEADGAGSPAPNSPTDASPGPISTAAAPAPE